MIHCVAINSKLVWSNTVTHTKEQVIPLTHSIFRMTITVDNEINASFGHSHPHYDAFTDNSY